MLSFVLSKGLLLEFGSMEAHNEFLMDLFVRVLRPQTVDVVVIPVLSMVETHLVSILYLAQRFGIDRSLIRSLSEGGDDSNHPLIIIPSEDVREVRHWNLRVGTVDSITCSDAVLQEGGEESELVLDLEESDGDKEDDVAIRPIPIYRISSSDSILCVKGTSEISKFVARFLLLEGEVHHVQCLPKNYNGDAIFELPPVQSLPKRGVGLKYRIAKMIVIGGRD